MSLFSKRNLFDSIDKPDEGQHERSGQGRNRRKKQKPRRFEISESELEIEHPVLGGNSSIGSFGFLSSSSPSLFDTPAEDSLLKPVPSKPSSLTLKSESERGKIVESALASSKLPTLTPSGPVEATLKLGKRKLKATKKYEKSLTKGSKWFNMAKVELTKEKKNDLEALKLRSAMTSIHHYKRNHMTHTPKYFHVGTIVEHSADFYSSRLTKKQRKKTLADEFAADFGMD